MTGTSAAERWIGEYEYLTTPRGHRIAYRRRGSGPTVLLVHGFPTWSIDWVDVAHDLERDHDVITLDLLGYGASDKPDPYDYSVEESADTVEHLLAELGVTEVDLVVHDYGSIVGQEVLDRHGRGVLGVGLRTVTVLNGGIVYAAYRPTRLQRLLITPVLGRVIARLASARTFRAGIDGVRGGGKIAHLLIRYNAERARHHERWERALAQWAGPLHLVWGPEDPVSGRHVLDAARAVLPRARVTEIEGAGHFPMSEDPVACAAAIRAGLSA
jgi:pimeloyl-ACP methyl ester carboxylesterase